MDEMLRLLAKFSKGLSHETLFDEGAKAEDIIQAWIAGYVEVERAQVSIEWGSKGVLLVGITKAGLRHLLEIERAGQE